MDPIEHERRLTRLEDQVNRLLSDAESEKDTRRRTSDDLAKKFEALVANWDKRIDMLEVRIRVLERNMYIAAGFIAALQIILKLA